MARESIELRMAKALCVLQEYERADTIECSTIRAVWQGAHGEYRTMARDCASDLLRVLDTLGLKVTEKDKE
jgi:hypothetical protein